MLETGVMRSLIIKDTQSRVYRYSLDDFLKWLNEAYRSSNGDVTITLPTPKEEKSGFVLKHPHPLGDIVVFNSARMHPYAPVFNVFSLMWAKTFFELGYSVRLLPNERTREIKEYIKKTSPCLIFGGLCEKTSGLL